jgi:hypothetical protein
VLRTAVDEVCGTGCPITSDNERPVITIQADAADAEEAVEVLQAKAQELVRRLDDYSCAIEMTSRLDNRYVDLYPPEAPSLGEGA